jgi:hypothetical protein
MQSRGGRGHKHQQGQWRINVKGNTPEMNGNGLNTMKNKAMIACNKCQNAETLKTLSRSCASFHKACLLVPLFADKMGEPTKQKPANLVTEC